eukprot:7386993-Prymnesium_polylepis.1
MGGSPDGARGGGRDGGVRCRHSSALSATADHVTTDHVPIDHVTADHVTIDHVTADHVTTDDRSHRLRLSVDTTATAASAEAPTSHVRHMAACRPLPHSFASHSVAPQHWRLGAAPPPSLPTLGTAPPPSLPTHAWVGEVPYE